MTTYNNGRFEMAVLTDEQIQFLNAYAPADDYYTSEEEMNKVIEVLNLRTIDRQYLRPVRNSVVGHYHGMSEKFESMLSVTAVIDYVMYQG